MGFFTVNFRKLSERNIKVKQMQTSRPIKINNNIVIIKLNDKRTLNQKNMDIAKIERDIIQKKERGKIKYFLRLSLFRYRKKSYIEIR